jgi:hypothetical protein
VARWLLESAFTPQPGKLPRTTFWITLGGSLLLGVLLESLLRSGPDRGPSTRSAISSSEHPSGFMRRTSSMRSTLGFGVEAEPAVRGCKTCSSSSSLAAAAHSSFVMGGSVSSSHTMAGVIAQVHG